LATTITHFRRLSRRLIILLNRATRAFNFRLADLDIGAFIAGP
jgi:hypothetical protein